VRCCRVLVGAECQSAGIAARTLANIADMLGAMSRGAGGLRSGPASNRQWNYAFQLLEVRGNYLTLLLLQFKLKAHF